MSTYPSTHLHTLRAINLRLAVHVVGGGADVVGRHVGVGGMVVAVCMVYVCKYVSDDDGDEMTCVCAACDLGT